MRDPTSAYSPAAERTMVIERVIAVPPATLWDAWTDPASLPQWWGPDGFYCKTRHIDLREGGEWDFDMIGPDGTVFPNWHVYTRMTPFERIEYTLHWGKDGPKHADSRVTFHDMGGSTRVLIEMTFVTKKEYKTAKGFGAVELGLQTLGKLARAVAVD